MVDWKRFYVILCYLMVCIVVFIKLGIVLRFCLVYKWKFEVVFFDSKDFVVYVDFFVESVFILEVGVMGMFIFL